MIKREGIYTKRKNANYFVTIIPKKGSWITLKIDLRIKIIYKINFLLTLKRKTRNT